MVGGREWGLGMTDEEMAYAGANDAACTLYPGEDEGPLRDAFCCGASYMRMPTSKDLLDKIEGLTLDLSSAVEVAIRRGATEWARLNYPHIYAHVMQQYQAAADHRLREKG